MVLDRRNFKDSKSYFEERDKNILLTNVEKFGNYLFTRIEYEKEMFHSVIDLTTGKTVLNRKASKDRDNWGICLSIDGIRFTTWPFAAWNGCLLLKIPQDVMSKISNGKNSNVGIAMLKISEFSPKIQ